MPTRLDGGISIRAHHAGHPVMDINGYFAPWSIESNAGGPADWLAVALP